MTTEELPGDNEKAKEMKLKSQRNIINTEVYKRDGGIFLKCLEKDDTTKMVDNTSGGFCSMHLVARFLALKIKNQENY